MALDNARHPRGDPAKGPGTESLPLPSDPPNRNLIGRAAAGGEYHPAFAAFRAAAQGAPDRIPTTHADSPASPMALRSQEFVDVSLLAA